MRHPRITYLNAFHHIMNKGYNGNPIFSNPKDKKFFLKILKKKSKKLCIRLLCYSLMDNHYHLILQNTSGKLSDFMRQINGEYAIYYRKTYGGKGYVFQNRYKSTLIQRDQYLKMAIIYVLLNPVRAGKVQNVFKYKWSSITLYFQSKKDEIVDTDFIEGIFQTKNNLISSIEAWYNQKIKTKHTPMGPILGDEQFIDNAIKKFDRRGKENGSLRKRKDDYSFKTPEGIIRGLEKKYRIKFDKIDVQTKIGKELRSELLVRLKNEGGLKYSEIIKYPIFKELKYSSLGQIYKRAIKKL